MNRHAFVLITIIFILTSTSCMVNYPMTTFYVKNNTDRTLNFKASIMKHTSMGLMEMTLPFSVPPHDSIVARKVNRKIDAPPTTWFTKFIIFPTDSVWFNDPKSQENWIKSINAKGKPDYTFIMTK